MWRNRFGAFPGIIGREMRLDDVTFTIVGVAARDGCEGAIVDRAPFLEGRAAGGIDLAIGDPMRDVGGIHTIG